MPVLILLGMFVVWAASSLYQNLRKEYWRKNGPIYDAEELDTILKEMVGKSEKEAQQILRMHRERWRNRQ